MGTKWVRPDTSHNTTRDGTSYATAWGGWAEVQWAQLAGGDTLKVCGRHVISAFISVGSIGSTSATNRLTIGTDASDPGTFACTGAGYVNIGKSNVIWDGLKFTIDYNQSITQNFAATLSDVAFRRCTFTSSAMTTQAAIRMRDATGSTYTNFEVTDCVFNGVSRAIYWIPAGGATCTINGFTYSRNDHVGCTSHAMEMRDAGASAATKLNNVVMQDNEFTDCGGCAMYVRYQGISGSEVSGNWSNCLITGNKARRCGSGSTWGSYAIGGWQADASAGTARCEIAYNEARDSAGPTGGFNLFYLIGCSFHHNKSIGATTTTIDGNGVLWDFGCKNCVCYSNELSGHAGKDGQTNSGVAIMVFESEGIQCWGNYGTGNALGFHVSRGSATVQNNSFHNNTFLGCTRGGVYVGSGVTNASTQFRNNVLAGAGYVVSNAAAGDVDWNYNAVQGLSGFTGQTAGAQDVAFALTDIVDYRPVTPTLKNVGVHMGYRSDAAGTLRSNPPSMGAYEARATRAASSRQ